MIRSNLFTTNDVEQKEGLDTYVNEGRKIKQLALQEAKRSVFFEERPKLNALLIREGTNPLVEEGNYQNKSRDRKGEFYLGYEALTLLIEKKIRGHKPKNHGLTYNSRNIFAIKNDIGNLEHLLKNLELAHGEDAKIIYISGIHSIPFYIRNEAGQIKCFVVDSEAGVYGIPDELIKVIKKVFPSSMLVLSMATLQKDFYSCSTFAVKAMMYFAKHGNELFLSIDKTGTTPKTSEHIVYQALAPKHLMPTLLKMCQSNLDLSEDTLNTIVSWKTQTTLKDYFRLYAVKTQDKLINSAALLKKYNYLSKLNSYIERDREPISSNPDTILPRPLQLRHDKYRRFPDSHKKTYKTNPIDVYFGIVSICDKKPEKPHKDSLLEFEKIKMKFPTFIKNYQGKFSNKDNLDDKYFLQAKKLFFVAAYAESTDLYYVREYKEFLKKLYKLFSQFDNVVTYLKRYAELGTKQPVHDLCLFTLPNNDNWNQKYWEQLILKHGHAASKYLNLAPKIEQLLSEYNSRKEKVRWNNDLELIKYLLENFSYKRAHENKELAKLCIRFLRSEEQFEECLSLVKNKLKSFDLLPEITIQGKEIEPKLAKFTFAKLPIGDLRGFFLGEYTACCQSINKAGSNCAIHGMTSPLGGFYVVYDEKKKIIAQTWAWIGNDGEIVFDSWEYIRNDQAYLCKPFILKAAEIILQSGFSRVLLGTGGKTPYIGLSQAKKPAQFRKNQAQYSDASSQYLIKSSSYATTLSKFLAFCNQNQLYYFKFSHLFIDPRDEFYFEKEISKLISSDQLTFVEWLGLIKFQYIVLHEFLHQKSEAHRALIFNAFRAYCEKMQTLYPLTDNKGIKLIEVFIGYDDPSLFKQIMNYLFLESNQGIEQIDTLLVMATHQNAIKLFKYIRKNYYQKISWDELALSKKFDGLSLLQAAAQSNSQKCVELILSKTNTENIKTLLMENPDQNGNILHNMARYNALENFKSISSLITPTMTQKTYQIEYRGIQINADVFLTALLSHSQAFALYLIEKGFLSRQAALKYIMPSGKYCIYNQPCWDRIIYRDDIDVLQCIHQLHENEASWLKTVMNSGGNDLLYTALHGNAYQCVWYLINSFKQFEHLHQLLTHPKNEYGNLPLEMIKYIQSANDIDLLIRKILAIYSSHKDKIGNSLFKSHEPVFCSIIKFKNLTLFHDVLAFLSGDTSLFNKVLPDILYTMITQLDERPKFTGRDPIPWQIKINFIDCLLSFCSDEQKKVLFSDSYFTGVCLGDSLTYLLVTIDTIDNGNFKKTWASLDSDIPFFLGLRNNVDQSGVTSLLLDYYIKLYGSEQINGWLSNNSPGVIYYCSHNLRLLHYMYPLIRSDNQILNQVYHELYGHMIANISLDIFEWLIDQTEIPDSLLIESMGIKKLNESYKTWVGCEFDSLIITNLLWKACAKRLPKDQLCSIAFPIYRYLHQRAVLVDCDEFYFNADQIKSLNAAKAMLDSMIKLIKTTSNRHMELLTPLFIETCDKQSADMMKIIMCNCNSYERIQLFEAYTEKGANKSKILSEINETINVLDKLDILLLIKSELTNPTNVKTSPNFFHSLNSEQQEMLCLFVPLNNIVLYHDKNKDLITLPKNEINMVWEKVLHYLKGKTVNQVNVDCFAINYQNYYNQMQEHPFNNEIEPYVIQHPKGPPNHGLNY